MTLDLADEVVGPTLLTHAGEVRHATRPPQRWLAGSAAHR